MGTIRCVCASAALVMATPLVPPAVAQTAEQILWCTSGSAGADKQIAGCTAMIESREYKGDKLAIVFNYRGIAYAAKKNFDRAIEDYNQAILHDFSNADIFYNRGIAYRYKGDYDHAIADFGLAITRFDPSRHPLSYKRDYFKQRGDAYRGKEDFANAITDYSEAIKIDPKLARAFYSRGEAKRKIGDAAGGDADVAQAKQLQKDIGPEE